MSAAKMRITGYLLLFGGIVPAFSMVLLRETPWGWFLLSAAFSGAGALVLRRYGMTARQAPFRCRGEVREGNDGRVLSLLDDIGSAGSAAVAGEDSHGVSDEVLQEAMERMQMSVAGIVEMTGEITGAMGDAPARRFLHAFAAAERMLARAWSALVDGYRDEALRFLDLSLGLFTAAGDLYREHCRLDG